MDKVNLLVPTSERVYHKIVDTLRNAGINFNSDVSNGSYMTETNIPRLNIVFKKDPDIPLTLLSSPDTLAGFVGYDYIREVGLKEGRYRDFIRLVDTELAPCKMVIAGPEEFDSFETLIGFEELRIGSKYPYSARDYLQRRGVRGKYIERRGTIEGMPSLGESDVIVDIEYTGGTLRRNNLRRIQELFPITIGLYTTRDLYQVNKQIVDVIGRRIQEVVNGKKKIWLEANVSADNLDRVLKGLPAMKSPTIGKLKAEGWFGIKSVVDIEESFLLISDLEKLGAQDIVTYSLQSVGVRGTYNPIQLTENDLQH
jgi:ATP phosphoribosyltransferase